MNILFLGYTSGTSKHRANALARLGHEVTIVSPEEGMKFGRVRDKLNAITGSVLAEGRALRYVVEQIGDRNFDMTWVEGGRLVGPELVVQLQQRFGPVLNFNHDDPYGKRDGNTWRLYRKTVPMYDLIAVVRQENVYEAHVLGATRVERVYMSADEVAHAPRVLTAEDHARWDSEVVFVGTYFPERGPFMAELIQRGVPLTIYGGLWKKAKEWPLIQKAWKGPETTCDDDYAKALQCAKVSLGLLSKGNRDLHTTRSSEVPSLGTVFCAERTSEHRYLYCEGEEAAFWSDAAECADVCQRLLADDGLRLDMGRRGRERCLRNGTMNEQIISQILRSL